jgi:hypothetical protein
VVRGAVELNSVGYAIRADDEGQFIRREDITPFASVQAPIGGERRESIISYTSKVWADLTGGYGRRRIRSDKTDDPEEYRRFYLSRLETRFESGVYLPLNTSSAGQPTDGVVIRADAIHNSEIFSVWDKRAAGYGVVAATFDASAGDWVQHSIVATSGSDRAVALDLMTHKTRLFCLLLAANDYLIRYNTTGTTWTTPVTTEITGNLFSSNVGANTNNSYGHLVEIGGEIVAVLADVAAGSTTFFSSADSGDTWVDEAIDLPDSDDIIGAKVYPSASGEDRIYVMKGRTGLWEIDVSESTWTYRPLLTFRSINTSLGDRPLTLHKGQLWIGVARGDDAPAEIVVLDTTRGTYDFIYGHGLDRGDGVPEEMLGNIRWFNSIGDTLFMSVGGGAASRNAHILAHNGKGWHFMYRNSTANQEIDWLVVTERDEATPNLHLSLRTGGATVVMVYLVNPLVDPINATGSSPAVSLERVLTGTVDLPEIDGGMPYTPGTWLLVAADATDLSSSTAEEAIQVLHRTDGDEGSFTSLGYFISTDNDLKYASGAGIAGRSNQLRLSFAHKSGNGTLSPQLRSLEHFYIKRPATIERFTFTVDLGATAAMEDTDVEAVISNLEAARDSVTLATLQYANMTTVYVKVKLNWRETVKGADGIEPQTVPDAESRRYGFVEVVCEEVIA